MDTVPDNIRGPRNTGIRKVSQKIDFPDACIGVKVKRCGMRSSVLNVRAHRNVSNDIGPGRDPVHRDTTNPTESKTA